MKETTTTTARVWLDDDGIVHYVSIGVSSTADTVMEGLTAVGQLTDGKPSPILFDSRGWPSGDPASWVQYINMIEMVCSAAAVVVDAESASALGAFPARIDELVIPFQVFYDEDEALEFVRSYL